jgi:hypothetical protein
MLTNANKIIASIVLLIALVIIALVARVPVGPSVAELQKDLEKELPIGSSRDQVAASVKNHGMEQSPFLERERMINAIKRGVSRGLLSETSISAQFYFDEKNALQRFKLDEISTGL